jgi:hypothetical protein
MAEATEVKVEMVRMAKLHVGNGLKGATPPESVAIGYYL